MSQNSVREGRRLVVSVPARELAGAEIPGSVFKLSMLATAGIAADLRLALGVVIPNWTDQPGSVRCVARPEIFTHGSTLATLKQKLDGVTDHICFSAGDAVKVVPTLKNHLFLYGLHQEDRARMFRKLHQRAPEIFRAFDTQINTFHSLFLTSKPTAPATQIALPAAPIPDEFNWFFPFYLNRHSPRESAERMLEWGSTSDLAEGGYDRIFYLPLTERALFDRRFLPVLVDLVSRTFFSPKTCVLIRLPALPDSAAEVTARMTAALEAMLRSGLRLPCVKAASVFFVGNDVSEAALLRLADRLTLVLHESFEFWRYTKPLYRAAAEVNFYIDGQRQSPAPELREFIHGAFDRLKNVTVKLAPLPTNYDEMLQ